MGNLLREMPARRIIKKLSRLSTNAFHVVDNRAYHLWTSFSHIVLTALCINDRTTFYYYSGDKVPW